MAKKAKKYDYDPEWMYSVQQEGGSSTEHYTHLFDSEAAAEAYRKDAEKHTYDTDEPEAHPRPHLEQVAPLLYEMLRWLHETNVLDADKAVSAEIEALLDHAVKTEHLDDIIEATRKWWTKKKRKPFMGEGHKATS